MNNKLYKYINQHLEKEFGEGNVKLKPAKSGDEFDYILWFLSDDPDSEVIEKAKEIVNQYEPTLWLDELAFHSD